MGVLFVCPMLCNAIIPLFVTSTVMPLVPPLKKRIMNRILPAERPCMQNKLRINESELN